MSADAKSRERLSPKRRTHAVYNVLFPIWLLVWWPSWLWLVLIPANYLVDWLVLRWALRGHEERAAFCRRHTWKICLAGFVSDLVASALLLAISLFIDSQSSELAYDVSWGIMFNPFGHVGALLLTLGCIGVAGVLIYLLDRWLLRHAGLEAEWAQAAALRLALVTAPYLFLFPSVLLYS